MRRLIVFLLLVGMVGIGTAIGYCYFVPFQGYEGDVFVDIPRGTGTTGMGALLEEEGVVRSRWLFTAMRLLYPRSALQAGEYRFSSPQTVSQVFDTIRKGRIFYAEITIPEGSNMFDIANLLGQTDTVGAKEFLSVASKPDLIGQLDPQAPDLEGYLFPSTYRVTHKTTAMELCQAMVNEFRKQWSAVGGSSKIDIHHMVVLASLVEKESALPPERPLVAAVFANRLRSNIALQCDPTTIYAALKENRYRGIIHKSDLASKNLYNTYAHTGLPPGPIANPGVSALKAALQPANANYLYFVAKADGSGGHQFSAALSDHLKAVEAYRKRTASH